MNKRTVLLFNAVLAVCTPLTAAAQDVPLPSARWRTIQTDHFNVHYPDEMSEWTTAMASRLEAIYKAVSALVGNAPERKVTVIVDDPRNESNGSAWPGPFIYLWPTPPDPRSAIGENRNWSEIVSLHEFAHIAHFTRPTRNPLRRLISKLLPVQTGPIMTRAPRWVHEGYATYIEGLLTGSGRPHGTWRPAILRQWALEGMLPSYGEINSTEGFFGGSMAYLMGSAFVEWLVELKGEESLRHLWRRMTARTKRSFEESFSGVFGGPPRELYGRFTAELTGRALALERVIVEEGLEEGEMVQRLNWYTGDPAVSPDGQRIAIVLRGRKDPSRLVVWNREEGPLSDKVLAARERARMLDPEDVPAIEWKPREKEPVATLFPSSGRAYSNPRFMADSRRLLLTRPGALPDGRIRSDLFIWNFESGSLNRVTRGAGIREADPSPDGTWAVGLRCLNGRCDIVRIDLDTGTVTTLLEGEPDVGYHRPRISPDGTVIVTSVQRGPEWRLFFMDSAGSGVRTIGPRDGASRFDAVFTPEGNGLVCVSTRGGIANLELLDLASGSVRSLSRVTGAAVAPAVNAVTGEVLYLNLQSRGYDLRKVDIAGSGTPAVTETTSRNIPAGRIPVESVPAFEEKRFAGPMPYGAGPRRYIVLPTGSFAREGGSYGLTLANTDPVGRLGWTLTGTAGDESVLRGVSLRIAWRAHVPEVAGELFSTRHYPSRNEEGLPTPVELDFRYRGAALYLLLDRDLISHSSRYRFGMSAGLINGPGYSDVYRELAFARVEYTFRQTPGRFVLRESLSLDAAAGYFDTWYWQRYLGTVSLSAGRYGKGMLRCEAAFGEAESDGVMFEQFSVGGVRPMLFDSAIMSQRIAMPALPSGFMVGESFGYSKGEWLLNSAFSFYFWLGAMGRDLEVIEKIFGGELLLDSEAIPFLKIPGLQCRIGSGVRVDEPRPRKTRFYMSVSWRP